MSQTGFRKLTLEQFTELTEGVFVMSFGSMYEYASENITYHGRRGLDWIRHGGRYSKAYVEDLKQRYNNDDDFDEYFTELIRRHYAEVERLICAEIVRQGFEAEAIAFARRSECAPVEVIPAAAWHALKPVYDKEILRYDESTIFIEPRFVSAEMLPADHPMFHLRSWLEGSEIEEARSPGRPSAQHLVMAEFERRVARGMMEPRVSAEAKALSAWLVQKHPNAPDMSEKTIENHIRKPFRERAPK